MRVFDRLLRLASVVLLALCGAMIWTPAHASFPATVVQPECTANCFEYRREGWGFTTGPYSKSVTATCASYVGQASSTFNYSPIASYRGCTGGASPSVELATQSSPNFYGWYAMGKLATAPYPKIESCPANSTLAGGQCTCSTGFNESAGTCVAVPPCQWSAGQSFGKSTTSGTAEVPKGATAVCMYGCRWSITVSPDFWWKDASGVYVGHVATGSMTGTGEVCNGTEGANGDGGPASPTPPPDPEPFPQPPCQPGYIPGTVTANGLTTTLCQPAINTENKKEKQTVESTPEGPKTVTTSETTVCTGAGSCTTTTTTNTSINGAAPTTETKTETQSKGAYCASGTGKKECGTGSGSWQGDCVAGFMGEGDPVTVAMAKEIHVQNCLMNKVTAESALYDAAKVKTGDQTGDLPGNETKAITSADIDQTNAIVGGTCIADRTININLIATTSTLVLPFSSICPLLDYFRLVLIALGFFIAYRIIGGR